jgi:hypothetical protein
MSTGVAHGAGTCQSVAWHHVGMSCIGSSGATA